MTDTQPPDAGHSPRISFVVDRNLVSLFFMLLQQGVRIRRRVGCSVDAFLRQEIGASPETIEKIQSIMLDGKPVDDIGSALVHDGSVLALSAAMPGLVGATLRRGGSYAAFRSGITYRETEKPCATGEGWVTVKIFNLLMAEMGPGLLRTGVLIRSSDILGLLKEREEELQRGCRVMLDNNQINIELLKEGKVLAGKDQVFLTVEAGIVVN